MRAITDLTFGVLDAFAWPACFVIIYGSKRLQSRILQSILINGGIFCGSIFLFEFGIKLFSINDGWLMEFLFQFLLVYPIFIVSLLISNRCYSDIGNASSVIFLGSIRSSRRRSGSQSLFSLVAVKGYYWMLLGVLIIQAKVLSLIPFIGTWLSFFLFSIISAWYSFEYSWNSLNYTLEKKVQLMEENWTYFLGFGAPLTLLTFFSPFTLNQGIFALLLPFYIIMANKATPHISKLSCKKRLPFFQPAIGIINLIVTKSSEKTD